MLLKGLVAGVAGTTVLDLYSYGDMAFRGRAASELPATVVAKLAERLGLVTFAHATDDASRARRAALGAFLGYGVGLGGGIAYAAIRPFVRAWLPWQIAGVVLGGATLIASEGSATALGATDWRTWSATDWVADVVPRTLYGLTTAWAVENADRNASQRRVRAATPSENIAR